MNLPLADHISSAANPRFRALLSLVLKSRSRRERGASVIEGPHLLDAYLSRFGAPRELYVLQHAQESKDQRALIERTGLAPCSLTPGLFRQLSQVEHGAGPIAVIDTPEPTLAARVDFDAVYLDGIQDPGNVGTILRSCAAVGISRVMTGPGTAFCWSPKVLRAAQGAHFQLDIHEGLAWSTLLERCQLPILYADAQAPQRIDRICLKAPLIWVLGNEGSGVNSEIRCSAQAKPVAIAQTARVESLNVGVAAAICLYEQWRQRGYPGAAA